MANEVATRPERRRQATLEGVRLIFRNFSGKEGQYNRAGDRNFNVVLPLDIAQAMEREGWNVKYREGREEGDETTARLEIAVNFKGPRPPRIILITSRGRTTLSESEVDILDWADMANVDLIISPYEWSVNGRTGVKAYLQSIYVTLQEDELEQKYADVPEIGTGQQAIGSSPESAQDIMVLHEIRDEDLYPRGEIER